MVIVIVAVFCFCCPHILHSMLQWSPSRNRLPRDGDDGVGYYDGDDDDDDDGDLYIIGAVCMCVCNEKVKMFVWKKN